MGCSFLQGPPVLYLYRLSALCIEGCFLPIVEPLCRPAGEKPRMSPERKQPRMQTYISCEPAQSKHMSRFHKSHFIRKLTSKMPQTKAGLQTLCQPAQSKHKSHSIQIFTGKMPRLKTAPQTLREPAQSKRMSRFHCEPKQHIA